MPYSQISLTEGAGPKASATDVVDSKHVQIVKSHHGGEGVSTPVTTDTPLPVAAYGELVEALESLRMAVQSLTRSGLGQSLPDTSGRIRVLLDAISASLTLATVSTVSTVTTVTTVTTVSAVTNQTQIGGTVANDHIPALLHLQADNLRRNIAVT